MKTIQEHLRELDHEKLIEQYLDKYPMVLADLYESHPEWTVESVRTKCLQTLREYLHKLCTIKTELDENGHHGILYAHRCIVQYGWEDPLVFDMMIQEELLVQGFCAEDYAYDFSEQNQIMGYYVAETPLTQKYLYKLAANVMWEASWCGYLDQDIDGWPNHGETEEEDEQDDDEPLNYDEFCSFAGVERKPEPDEDDTVLQKLKKEAEEARSRYWEYSRKRERKLILEQLRAEQRASQQKQP